MIDIEFFQQTSLVPSYKRQVHTGCQILPVIVWAEASTSGGRIITRNCKFFILKEENYLLEFFLQGICIMLRRATSLNSLEYLKRYKINLWGKLNGLGLPFLEVSDHQFEYPYRGNMSFHEVSDHHQLKCPYYYLFNMLTGFTHHVELLRKNRY